jgi:adenosylmethionine-8-amino-7-oxononanoate aminotransferase
MITFAKGVTSGYLPLGGVIVADEIAEPFWRAPGGPVFRHGPTYSAHATCCAAGLANIGILENEGLLTKGAENEGELLDAIRPLADSESVAEIRGGIGTLAAVELTAEVLERDKNAVARVALAAREAGVLVRPLGRGVATSPPLTATSEHFAMIGEAIEHGLAALHAVSARG